MTSKTTSLSTIFAVGVLVYWWAIVCIDHFALQYASEYTSVEPGNEQSLTKHQNLHDPTNAHGAVNQAIGDKKELLDNEIYAKNEAMEKLLRNEIPDINRPDIVWLMSYPNSGTTFTLRLVITDSNQTVATNYPAEPHFNGHEHENLYQSSNVPFLLFPNMSMPSKYILTKTHCGGHCLHCDPEDFAKLEIKSFLSDCSSSKSKDWGHYENSANQRVKKAVHLMRNPIDNSVSNFHHLLKQFKRDNHTGLLKLFPNNKKGFRDFCELQDHKWRHQEKKIFGEEMNVMKHVKCHGTFYKWIQWHNLVFNITRYRLKVPTLPMWYEDYTTDFNDVKKALFDFLELESVSELWPFEAGKTYQNYFTVEEKNNIIKMIQHFAIPEVWEMVKRYAD